MSARRADLKSRRKLVQCKKHGLHYDADLHSGCVLCRKENPTVVQAVTPNLWRVWGPLVLFLLLLAGVLYWQTRPQPTAPETGAGAEVTRIDPRTYRGQFAVIERRLFDPAVAEGGAELRAAVEALAAVVRRREPPALAGPVAARLDEFARDVAAGPTATARNAWQSLRGELFADADWFRTGVRASPAAGAAATAAADPAVVAATRRAIERLDRAITRNTPTAVDLARQLEARTADALATWNDWTGKWLLELDEIGAELAAAPSAESDLSLGAANEELQAAIAELQRIAPLPEDAEAPADADVSASFAAARDHVDSAARYLEQVGGTAAVNEAVEADEDDSPQP